MQNAAVLLGLCIDGRPMISPVIADVRAMCQELLGVTPDDSAFGGTSLRLRWLRDTFGAGPPHEVTEDVVRQFAREHILALIGTVLFADKSGNQVRFFYYLCYVISRRLALFLGVALFWCAYIASCVTQHSLIIQALPVPSFSCRHRCGSASTLIVRRD